MDVTHWNISDRRCLLRKICSSCFIFLLEEPHTHSLFWMRVCAADDSPLHSHFTSLRGSDRTMEWPQQQVDETFPFVVLNVGHTCYYDDYCPRIFGPSQHLGCCFSSSASAEGPFVWVEMRRIFPLKESADDSTLSSSKNGSAFVLGGRRKCVGFCAETGTNSTGLFPDLKCFLLDRCFFLDVHRPTAFSDSFHLKWRKRSKCRQVNKLIEISESHFVSDLIMNRSRFLFDCISATDECTCNLGPVSSTINGPTGGPIRYFVLNFFQLIDFPVTREDWGGISSRQALG